MSQIKILHCADTHIGSTESFLGLKSKQRQAETLRTFQKTVEYAVNEEVNLFLIAGDLFDSFDVDYSSIREVLTSVSNASKIKFVYAAGNHDPLSVDSPFARNILPSNLFVLDTKDSFFTFDELGVRVYGRSFKEVYDKGEETFSILPPDDDYINIMCIHGELTSDKSTNYNPITKQFIEKSGMDYIALGHIHKCTDIGKIGKTSFAYCGCLEGQGFDEQGKKGVLVGNIAKDNISLSFVPMSSRAHFTENIDISGVSSSTDAANIILSYLKETHGEGYENNLYKIVLTGTLEENTVKISETLALLAESLYFVKLKDKTSPAVDLELLAKEPSLKGLFVSKILEKIKNADESEKAALDYALSLGLKSFGSEVSFDED